MVGGSIGVVAGAAVVVVAPPAPPAPAPAPASESDGTVVAAANAAADAVVPVAAENVKVNVFLLNTNSILTHCIISCQGRLPWSDAWVAFNIASIFTDSISSRVICCLIVAVSVVVQVGSGEDTVASLMATILWLMGQVLASCTTEKIV